MNKHPYHARRSFLVVGLTIMLAAPIGAQSDTTSAPGAGSTTGTASMGGTSAGVVQDTTITRRDDDNGFPWGLLGLLGLGGLLGRRRVDTVHHDTIRTARPGDPNYRV